MDCERDDPPGHGVDSAFSLAHRNWSRPNRSPRCRTESGLLISARSIRFQPTQLPPHLLDGPVPCLRIGRSINIEPPPQHRPVFRSSNNFSLSMPLCPGGRSGSSPDLAIAVKTFAPRSGANAQARKPSEANERAMKAANLIVRINL